MAKKAYDLKKSFSLKSFEFQLYRNSLFPSQYHSQFKIKSFCVEAVFSLVFSICFLVAGSILALAQMPTWRFWQLGALESWLRRPPESSLAVSALFAVAAASEVVQGAAVVWKWSRRSFPTNLAVGHLLLRLIFGSSLLYSIFSGMDSTLLLLLLLLYELPRVPSLVAQLRRHFPRRIGRRLEPTLLLLHCLLFVGTRFLAAHFYSVVLVPFARSNTIKSTAFVAILISYSSAIFHILSRLKKSGLYCLASRKRWSDHNRKLYKHKKSN